MLSPDTMSGEFDIIRQCFSQGYPADDGVIAGVGDDAALLKPSAGKVLAMSCDTLVDGVHFPAGEPSDIGYRSLAVNLSDLAAMGARPRWFMLALTIPDADATWLQGFAAGLADCASSAKIALVGGDTTRGPLSITIQVMGDLPEGTALLRSGAKAGDAVFVSGKLGAAAAFIAQSENLFELPAVHRNEAACAFWRPRPQLALGEALRGVASAAIDISDGLIRDLGHILDASGVGATLQIDRLPLADLLLERGKNEQDYEMAAGGGDDYQLCFTVPADRLDAIDTTGKDTQTALTRVGTCTAGAGLDLLFDGKPFTSQRSGYQHFAGESNE